MTNVFVCRKSNKAALTHTHTHTSRQANLRANPVISVIAHLHK